MSTGGLSAAAKLVPWSRDRFAALFTVFTINVLPVYHPPLYKAPDFWNANEVCGCLFVLLFWWLDEQWQAARVVVIVVLKWTLHVRFHLQSFHQMQRTFIKMVKRIKPPSRSASTAWLNAECQCEIRSWLLISFSREISSERRKCDIFIRTFQSLFFIFFAGCMRESEPCFCSSGALNKCDSALRRPVLHIMKCQESEAWWINLSAFNRDIISSAANSAEKCFWANQIPPEDRAAIFCQSVLLILSCCLRATAHIHTFSVISYLHEFLAIIKTL